MNEQYCKVKTTRSVTDTETCKDRPCVPKPIIGIANEACEKCDKTF